MMGGQDVTEALRHTFQETRNVVAVERKKRKDEERRDRLRYYAAHAPVDHNAASFVFGGQLEGQDAQCAGFMAVWAHLRFEYAEAMLREEEQRYG